MPLYLRPAPTQSRRPSGPSFQVHNGRVILGSISQPDQCWRWYLPVGRDVGYLDTGEEGSREDAMRALANTFRLLCAENEWDEGGDFHNTSLAFPP